MERKKENDNFAMIILFIFIWNKTIDSVLYMKMNNKFEMQINIMLEFGLYLTKYACIYSPAYHIHNTMY